MSTGGNDHFEFLLLVQCFLSVTGFTSVAFVDQLAFALTVFADLLHALHHVRADLSSDQLNSVSSTSDTRLLGALFPAHTKAPRELQERIARCTHP